MMDTGVETHMAAWERYWSANNKMASSVILRRTTEINHRVNALVGHAVLVERRTNGEEKNGE